MLLSFVSPSGQKSRGGCKAYVSKQALEHYRKGLSGEKVDASSGTHMGTCMCRLLEYAKQTEDLNIFLSRYHFCRLPSTPSSSVLFALTPEFDQFINPSSITMNSNLNCIKCNLLLSFITHWTFILLSFSTSVTFQSCGRLEVFFNFFLSFYCQMLQIYFSIYSLKFMIIGIWERTEKSDSFCRMLLPPKCPRNSQPRGWFVTSLSTI